MPGARVGPGYRYPRRVRYVRVVQFLRTRRIGKIPQQQKVHARARLKRRHRLKLAYQFPRAFGRREQARYHNERTQIFRHALAQVEARKHPRLNQQVAQPVHCALTKCKRRCNA